MFNTNKKFAEKYYEMEEKLLGGVIMYYTEYLKENRVGQNITLRAGACFVFYICGLFCDLGAYGSCRKVQDHRPAHSRRAMFRS